MNEKPRNLSFKEIIGLAVGAGIFYGVATGYVWNPQVGIEVGIAMSGLAGGMLLGKESSDRAIELARGGNRFKAYLKSLESTLEVATAFAVAGATAGFATAGPEGAAVWIIWGAATGALIGAGEWGFANVLSLSSAFGERNKVRRNTAI